MPCSFLELLPSRLAPTHGQPMASQTHREAGSPWGLWRMTAPGAPGWIPAPQQSQCFSNEAQPCSGPGLLGHRQHPILVVLLQSTG